VLCNAAEIVLDGVCCCYHPGNMRAGKAVACMQLHCTLGLQLKST
jgi:hypothetical protein